MALHFLDSSALAKRYLTEVGSVWVDSLCEAETIAISSLVTAELASTLARRAREGSIAALQRDESFKAFLADRHSYIVLSLTNTVMEQAATLLLTCPPTIPLRSLDALHLVCAQRAFAHARRTAIPEGLFVSADHRLLAAAQWAGLSIDNPENHP